MTTFDVAAAAFRGARTASRQARAEKRAHRTRAAARTVAVTIRRSVLTVAGLAAFTVAAWTVALPLGLAVGGVCALYLEWLLGDA